MRQYYTLLVLLGALLLTGCGQGTGDSSARQTAPGSAAPLEPGRIILPPDSPKLDQIRVAAVRIEEIPLDEVDAPGKIEVNPNRVAHVLSPVTGRIGAVLVKLGDTVTEGQTVLTIESPDADAAESGFLQASAALTQAQANRLKAQADLDRLQDLFEHSAVARKEVLNAENALAQAKASVEQTEAARTQAQRRLQILGLSPGAFGQKVNVKAPIAGKVLEMAVARGEYRNDPNASLVTIADLDTVWVASDVPETSIRFIRPGESISLELTAYPGQRFAGRVTRIADIVDQQTRTVKVRAEISNVQGRFLPEMYGRIRHVHTTLPAVVVPSGAIIQADGASFVYVEVARGIYQRTRVRPGKPLGDRFPILEGLRGGDRVVVDGVMLLKNG